MNMIIKLIRIIAIIFFILFQQGFIVVLGYYFYIKEYHGAAVVVWLLCLPMIYINYHTYKFIMKFGLVNYHTINADTSDLDVEKGKRWYDKN